MSFQKFFAHPMLGAYLHTYTAREAGFTGTDDCSLAERIKYNTVQLVDCGRENMKITTPEDVFFAEAFLALRKKREENENAQ